MNIPTGIKKLKVRVYVDSRGVGLNQEIRKYSTEEMNFSACFIRGATLRVIWELIESDLLFSDVDVFIVYASICDITDRTYTRNGRRVFLPPYDMDTRFEEIESTMHSMANNFQLVCGRRKLCFFARTWYGSYQV